MTGSYLGKCYILKEENTLEKLPNLQHQNKCIRSSKNSVYPEIGDYWIKQKVFSLCDSPVAKS